MTKHTPGPWRIMTRAWTHYILASSAVQVAVVFQGIDVDGQRCKMSDAEYQANAHLIVAAPELLRVLESIEWIKVSSFSGTRRCPCCGEIEESGHRAKCLLRNTIDKALGKEPQP